MRFQSTQFFYMFFVILLSLIIVLLIPKALSLDEDSNSILFLSYSTNIYIYVLEFIIAIVTIVILIWIKDLLLKVFVLFIAIVIVIQLNKVGFNHYIHLHESYIEYKSLEGDTLYYHWDELKKVTHERNVSSIKKEKYRCLLQNKSAELCKEKMQRTALY